MRLNPQHKLSSAAEALRSVHAAITGDCSLVAKYRTIVCSSMTARCLSKSFGEGPVEHLVSSWLLDVPMSDLAKEPASVRLNVMRRCTAEGLAPDLAAARAIVERAGANAAASQAFDRTRSVVVSRDAAVNHLHPMIHSLELSASATTNLIAWVADTSAAQHGPNAMTLLVAAMGPELWSARWLYPLREEVARSFRLADTRCIACCRDDSVLDMVAPVPVRKSRVSVGHDGPDMLVTFVGELESMEIGILDDASLIAVGSDEHDGLWFRRGWCLTQLVSRFAL